MGVRPEDTTDEDPRGRLERDAREAGAERHANGPGGEAPAGNGGSNTGDPSLTADGAAAATRTLAIDAAHALAAFYDRRAPAALAYCSRLCPPESIADAVEVAFGSVFEAAAGGEPLGDDVLDRRLRSAVRAAAAERAPTPEGSTTSARRLFERTVSDPGRGTCALTPRLLAARAEAELSTGDRERLQTHLRRCADCRAAERRFVEAERAYDALAGDDAPALGRSLLADLMASDAPPREVRRFEREPVEWLEPDELDWHPRVIPVPSDALDGVDAAGDETAINEGATGEAAFSDEVVSEAPPVEDEPRVEDAPVEEPPVEDEPPVEEPPIDDSPVEAYADPEPDIAEPEQADADRVESARRDPAVTGASTAEFAAIQSNRRRLPLPRLAARTRKRIAIVMLVIGVLLLAEAALTVLWKEPFTAFIAARSQDSLDSDLAKLQKDKAALNAGDEAELAKIDDAGEREQRRMALLAANLDDSVKEGEALGRIRIPKLGTDFVFVQGTEAASLRKGPGHYHGKTTLPGEGAAVGIAGHRTTYEAPFREIDELKSGDRITLRMPYGLFTYEVTTRKIVPADFTGAFSDEQSAGAGERLVLSACHPLYSAEKRILVYAKLTASEPLGAAVETSAPTVPGVPEEQLAQRRTALRLKRLGDRQLAEGMTGKDVRELQRLLGMPVTGTFDANTTAAVVEFQRRHGLPQIGSVGPQTKRALARQSKIPSRPPTPAPVPQQTQPGTNGAPGSQTPGANGTTQPQQPGGYTPPGGTQGGTGQGTYNGPSGGAPYTAPGGTAAPQGSSP